MVPYYAKLTLFSPSALSIPCAPHLHKKEAENHLILVDASLKEVIVKMLEKKQSPGLLLQDLNPDLISSLLNLLVGNCLFDVITGHPFSLGASSKDLPSTSLETNGIAENDPAKYQELPMAPQDSHRNMSRQGDEWLSKVNVEIDNHLDDENFKACKLAKVVSLCGMQFHRKLKKFTGLSPANYLRSYRLHKCLPLLEQGKLNVSEIAFSVGFRSLEYFSRSFKKEFGSNASCYQQQFKGQVQPMHKML